MIAKQDVYNVQTTVQGEKVAMGIDKSAMNHIMGIMSNMYSNKIRAMIREYSTNALDAQIEAGVYDKPIEVELPSQLSQFLKIRDYGIGLDTDGIRDIYSQYGASTKRSSNDVVGMLGIGCKAALAYTSQFTVTSVKDGEKIIVAIARDANGAGSMTVQSRFSTDEGNGTVVTIPVAREDIYKFGNEAADFFSVWDPKNVRIDGQPPAHHGGLKVADGLYMLDQRGRSAVVMGNVAYPAPQLADLTSSGSVIAYVPIGDVMFPPSREALQDDALTRVTLERIRKNFMSHIGTAIQREIDASETISGAIQIMLTWERSIPGLQAVDYTYGGNVIPRAIDCGSYNPPKFEDDRWGNKVSIERTFRVTHRTVYSRGSKPREQRQVPIAEVVKSIFIENYDVAEFNSQHRRKVAKWAGDAGLMSGFDLIVFCREEAPKSPFIPKKVIADWNEVKKIRLEPVKRVGGSTRIPGSYDLYTEDTSGQYSYGRKGIPGDDIRENVRLFHFEGNLNQGKRWAHMLSVVYDKFTLVCLPANRIPKWKREVTRSKSVVDEMPAMLKAWEDSLTARDRTVLGMLDANTYHWYKKHCHIADKVKDPQLRKPFLIAKLVKDADKLIEKRDAFRAVSPYGYRSAQNKFVFDCPLEKYPLFSWGNLQSYEDHIVAYVNAVYAAT
jgi:hypothetical protein